MSGSFSPRGGRLPPLSAQPQHSSGQSQVLSRQSVSALVNSLPAIPPPPPPAVPFSSVEKSDGDSRRTTATDVVPLLVAAKPIPPPSAEAVQPPPAPVPVPSIAVSVNVSASALAVGFPVPVPASPTSADTRPLLIDQSHPGNTLNVPRLVVPPPQSSTSVGGAGSPRSPTSGDGSGRSTLSPRTGNTLTNMRRTSTMMARDAALNRQQKKLEQELKENKPPLVVWWNPITWFRALFQVLLNSLVYAPFLYAVLIQTLIDNAAFPTEEWKVKLTGKSWLLAFGLFVLLLVWPFVLLFGVDQYLTFSVDPFGASDLIRRIPFIVLVLCVYVCTIRYASLRQELCELDLKTHKLSLTNGYNWFSIASVLIEFAQIAAVAFQSPIWYTPATASTGGGGAPDYPMGLDVVLIQFDNTDAAYWLVVSVVIMYMLIIGVSIAADINVNGTLGGFIFTFIPGTLFLSVATRLVDFMVPMNTSNDAITHAAMGAEFATTRAMNSMACGAFLAFLFYGTTAPFVAIYRTHEKNVFVSDIEWIPRFYVYERTVKAVACIFSQGAIMGHTSGSREIREIVLPSIQLWVYIGVCIWLIAIILKTKPCSYVPFGYFRVFLLLMAAWSLLVTFIGVVYTRNHDGMELTDSTRWIMIGVGWSLLVAAGVVWWLWNRCGETSAQAAEDAAFAAAAAAAHRPSTVT